MVYVWSALLLLIAVTAEIAVGSLAVPLHLTCLIAFYLFVSQGWKRPMALAAMAAVLLDVYYARVMLPTLALVPIVAYLAAIWRRHGDCSHYVTLAIPGALLGLAAALAAGLTSCLAANCPPVTGLQWVALIVSAAALAGAVSFPFLGLAADALGRRAGLMGLADIRVKRRKTRARGRR